MNILITGGAGFIGTHLSKRLLQMGEHVAIYDNLDAQVHRKPPSMKAKNYRLIVGDVRNREALSKEVQRADVIVHLAAVVGVGQSQYQIHRYVDVNVNGTGVLLDILANTKHRIRKLVVASSMSCYGEGPYTCARCGRVRPCLRNERDLENRIWDPSCPNCLKRGLSPVGTKESDPFLSQSVYAITKRTQEDLTLAYGMAYEVPSIALRFFNVYGPGQSLSNPYTGVAAIFISRLKNNQSPVLYEDGLQTRDFTSVHDIVSACILAIKTKTKRSVALNVGTGRATSILEVADQLSKALNSRRSPNILHSFRSGDIRHCYSDISEARKHLGFVPAVSMEEGFSELVDWSRGEEAVDLFATASKALTIHGLVKR